MFRNPIKSLLRFFRPKQHQALVLPAVGGPVLAPTLSGRGEGLLRYVLATLPRNTGVINNQAGDNTLASTELDQLRDEILALGLFNRHSGADVEPDDIYAYFDETQCPSVQDFKNWLAEP